MSGGWINTFQLGRPGYESSFDVNPDSLDLEWDRLGASVRTLAGDIKERVFKTVVPKVTIKTGFLTKAFLDTLVSMLSITDSFLSFKTRSADWNMNLELNLPLTTSTVQIQNTSISKLDVALYNATGTGQITINHVYINPDGSGKDYYTGGSYNNATRTITLGTALPSVQQVYCSYSFSGWLVQMKSIKTPITGGRVDLFMYDIELSGV